MCITVNGNDLKLNSILWDHMLTEHGVFGVDAAMSNGWRKSKWYGDEQAIEGYIKAAFDNFRQSAKAQGDVKLNKRTVYDTEIDNQCGTTFEGKDTRGVRLVMEINNAGDTTIVTAFPIG